MTISVPLFILGHWFAIQHIISCKRSILASWIFHVYSSPCQWYLYYYFFGSLTTVIFFIWVRIRTTLIFDFPPMQSREWRVKRVRVTPRISFFHISHFQTERISCTVFNSRHWSPAGNRNEMKWMYKWEHVTTWGYAVDIHFIEFVRSVVRV